MKPGEWKIIIIYAAAILAAFGGALAGVQRDAVRAAAVKGPAGHFFAQFQAKRATLELRRVPGVDRPSSVEAACRGLFNAMADDDQTLELLRSLFGGIPVELEVVDVLAVDKRSPTGAVTLFLTWPQPSGDQRASFDFRQVLRIPLSKPLGPSQLSPKVPSGATALFLAIQDYLLRNPNGWMAYGGRAPEGIEPGSAAHRAALDRAIAKYRAEKATWYEALAIHRGQPAPPPRR